MQSTTKTDIPRTVIDAMVRTGFGPDAVPGEVRSLDDGWFNSAYAIRFLDGTPDAVLRVAPDPEMRLLTYEKDLMRAEVEIHAMVQERLDVPVPRLLACDLIGFHVDEDVYDEHGTLLSIMNTRLATDRYNTADAFVRAIVFCSRCSHSRDASLYLPGCTGAHSQC